MRILALDQGTSGTKAIVVDDGRVASLVEVPLRPHYAPGGSVEQDPDALLESVLEAGRSAVRDAGGAIDAVALANQGESVLAWDPMTGQPVTPVIVWQDSRSQEICDVVADHADEIRARTGLVNDPYFTAPKMAWVRRHLTHAGVLTTTDTWVLHHLTGEFVTDASTASRSALMNLKDVAWDPTLMEIFGLSGESLPTIIASDVVVGVTSAFGPEVPVAGVIVDQQAALFAENCHKPGQMKCTYGTGAFLLSQLGPTPVIAECGLTTSVAWKTREGCTYCLDGQVYTAASVLRWLTDVGLLSSPEELDASTADDSAGLQFIPALAGLAAPWWRSDATASLTGLSLSATSGNIVRAALEGIAAQVAAMITLMDQESGSREGALRVDGGLTRSASLMQVQADLAQRPIEVYPNEHATALGTAALARSALDPTASLESSVWSWAPTHVYEPQWSRDRAADFLTSWNDTVSRYLPAKGVSGG